mgnify:CR=1 FL=1
MKYDSRMKINMTEKTSVEKTWKAYLNKIEPADRTAMELCEKAFGILWQNPSEVSEFWRRIL